MYEPYTKAAQEMISHTELKFIQKTLTSLLLPKITTVHCVTGIVNEQAWTDYVSCCNECQ